MLTFDEEKHEYWWVDDEMNETRLPSVSELIRPLIDHSGIPLAALERACRRGDWVHRITAIIDLGMKPCYDEVESDIQTDVRYMVAGYKQFKKDYNPKIIEVETMVQYQDKFAGRLDRVIELKDRHVLDLKCTSKIEDTHGLSTTAYEMAYNTGNPPYVLRLTTEGKYHLWQVSNQPILESAILSLYDLWYYKQLPMKERRGLIKVKETK